MRDTCEFFPILEGYTRLTCEFLARNHSVFHPIRTPHSDTDPPPRGTQAPRGGVYASSTHVQSFVLTRDVSKHNRTLARR
jgi:hypothetical protein